MTHIESRNVAVDAMRLQNGYARAIDTRNWTYFRTLFTPDVIADYPQNHYFEGMDDWLAFFVPFHDQCVWIQHIMTNHVIGEDGAGFWATCYGYVQWILADRTDTVNISATLYRDRLTHLDGAWLISRRKCDIIMSRPSVPIPEGQSFPASALDHVDVT